MAHIMSSYRTAGETWHDFNREMLALEILFKRCKEDLINITRLLCATGSKKYELVKREDLWFVVICQGFKNPPERWERKVGGGEGGKQFQKFPYIKNQNSSFVCVSPGNCESNNKAIEVSEIANVTMYSTAKAQQQNNSCGHYFRTTLQGTPKMTHQSLTYLTVWMSSSIYIKTLGNSQIFYLSTVSRHLLWVKLAISFVCKSAAQKKWIPHISLTRGK